MFEAHGKTLEDVFRNAGEALMSVVCEIKKVRPAGKVEIEAAATDPQGLLFEFLQQLIALVDIEVMFFSKFKVSIVDGVWLKAECWGEKADPAKGNVVVKAVTKHRFSLKKGKQGWKATAVLDI
jgi:SHS2 domain-containing protein